MVRGCLPTRAAQVFATLLVSSGIRFCEAIGLQPDDFDFDACVLEVARSVVKVSRAHHPQGKTFLVRDYTKNGQTSRYVHVLDENGESAARRFAGLLPPLS